MRIHPVRRLPTALLALAVWAVLLPGTAHAKPGPEDPSSAFVTQPPVVVMEPVSWTHYAVLAATACLIGVFATLAIQMVVRRGVRSSMAHA